jgi:hypothetical protein
VMNATSDTEGAVFFGYQAGNHTTTKTIHGYYNSFIGHRAGYTNTTGANNTFLGYLSGFDNTSGSRNVFLGGESGTDNTTGVSNIFLGWKSGFRNTTGNDNVYIGNNAGSLNTTSNGNVFVGSFAGYNGTTGVANTYIGYFAGGESTGNNNVFLGNYAGYGEASSNKLYIHNQETTTPLIWGDFALSQLKLNGKVGIGIGTSNFPTTAGGVNVSAYKLFVKGGILTEEVRVNLQTAWADYVFAKDYKLAPLEEVEKFIGTNGHLPNVPSAKQVKEDGIELGQMANLQQEKIEELTLYLIEQNKKIEKQEKEIEELKAAVKALVSKN